MCPEKSFFPERVEKARAVDGSETAQSGSDKQETHAHATKKNNVKLRCKENIPLGLASCSSHFLSDLQFVCLSLLAGTLHGGQRQRQVPCMVNIVNLSAQHGRASLSSSCP